MSHDTKVIAVPTQLQLLERSPNASTCPGRGDRADLFRDLSRRTGTAAARWPRMTATQTGQSGRSRALRPEQGRRLHIEIPAEEYQAMQPPTPAGGFGGPPPAPRPKKAGASGEREEPLRGRVPLGARDLDGRGPDVQGRRPSLCRQRLVHGVGRRLEAIVQGRSRPHRPTRISAGFARSSSKAARSTRRRLARYWPTPSSARRAYPRLARRSPR